MTIGKSVAQRLRDTQQSVYTKCQAGPCLLEFTTHFTMAVLLRCSMLEVMWTVAPGERCD